jgi:molybdate transport system permease protein
MSATAQATTDSTDTRSGVGHSPAGDLPFIIAFSVLGGSYVLLIAGMLLADLFYTTPGHLLDALRTPEIQYSIKLSLVSCTLATVLSLWVAVPLGYLMSRYNFFGKTIVDALLDVPIILPPLVVGLSLLILVQTPIGQFVESIVGLKFTIPGVILAQFAVACAFSVRTMRATFDEISPRQEQVAMTLGCSRSQAFWHVVMPEARRGVITAATLAWARSLGEFGPILIFSGATRMRTEVLSTSVFLELSVGRLEAAVAVSLIMIAAAFAVLITLRIFGVQSPWTKAV